MRFSDWSSDLCSSDLTEREPALNALFDGELDSLNASEVEAHIRTCPTCGAYIAFLSDVREAMASAMLDDAAPAALRWRIEAQVAVSEERRVPPKPPATRRYLPWLDRKSTRLNSSN